MTEQEWNEIPQVAPIDYEELLKKYMTLVILHEGTSFLFGHLYDYIITSEQVNFTQEELEELWKISCEI